MTRIFAVMLMVLAFTVGSVVAADSHVVTDDTPVNPCDPVDGDNDDVTVDAKHGDDDKDDTPKDDVGD